MRNQSEQEDDNKCVDLPYIRSKPSKKKLKPIIANLIDTQYQIVYQVCEEIGFDIIAQKDTKDWDLRWTDSAVTVEALSKQQSHQKVNHFPGMNILSRKNNLAKQLQKMQEQYPQHYSYAPLTFLLPTDASLFRSYYNNTRKRGHRKTFIVKPQASCQGRGIFLTQSLSDIQAHGQCVVQNYIQNPLLYKGLKFDMRIYALIAGCDPLRIYLYNEGLVRFATQRYEQPNEQNMDNLYMHLTNYAINKDSPKYVFNESIDNLSHGHKKSLAEFFQTLKSNGHPAHQYWSGIKDTIVKTVISGQPHLQHQYRVAQPHNLTNNMCFQILGFDFMIDDKNKLYLLQINYTPSFSTQTPLDELIKSNLIRDALILMNVTPEARNKAQKLAKQQLQRRVFTGKTTKLTPQQREIIIKMNQKQRDNYQKNHLGSFQRIYPSKNSQRQERYQQFLNFSAQIYKQQSSPTRASINRRHNSRYRIKKLISNNSTIQQEEQNKNKKQSKKLNGIFYKQQYNPEQKSRNIERNQFTSHSPQTAISKNRKIIVANSNKHHQSLIRQSSSKKLLYLQPVHEQNTMFSKLQNQNNEETSA